MTESFCSHWCASRPGRALRAGLTLTVLATLAAFPGCGGSGGTAPTAIDQNIRVLTVECRPVVIIGEVSPCVAVAILADGRPLVVSPVATWSTGNPGIVSVNAIGDVRGVAAGQSSIRVSYGGREASTTVSVKPGDAMLVASVTEQGVFAPGNWVTLSAQGFYAVQSADAGALRLLIYDHRGTAVVGDARPVPRGGDAFLLSVSFQVPAGSTRLCRRVRLTVGPAIIEEPSGAASESLCVAVQQP